MGDTPGTRSSRVNVLDFCTHCAQAVNKEDITEGWDLFSSS